MGTHRSEEDVFHEVSSIVDPAARSAYLDQACSGDEELRRAVEELLEFHETDGDFLETPALGSADARCRPRPGDVIDGYVIVEHVGEGGFGIVYRARQTAPLSREVALKVLKPGMDTEEVVGRFRLERETLAAMSHANIATVLDAGSTPRGRPYIVMELVQGSPVDEYCEANRLTIDRRLRLLLDVCRAVQHAHQKGVVHRDLKPSNVLVSDQNGDAVVKVIDFGIAKALETSPSMTRQPQLLGTPDYMSPEQAARLGDVDTRSDVYSLGALLYKLLTGASIREAGRSTGKGATDPPLPSAYLRSLGQEPASTIARGRCARPHELRRAVSGDLDWIARKALQPDRADRYPTVEQFASDLERFLQRRPVSAGPPTVRYRLTKFARRNRALSAAAGLLLLSLVLGATFSTIGFLQARRERQRATREWRNAVAQARLAARERDNAAETAYLLERLIEFGDPEQGRAADYTVREMMDEFSDRLGDRWEVKPEIEAKVRRLLGRSYLSIGDMSRAGPHLERALELRLDRFGDEHPLTAQSLVDHAVYLFWMSRVVQAQRTVERALKILPAERPSEELVWAHMVLAGVHREYGELEVAMRHRRASWETARKAFGDEHPLTIMTRVKLAYARYHHGMRDLADTESRESLEQILRARPETHPDVAEAKRVRAIVLRGQREWEEAERLAREALEIDRLVLGPDSSKVVRDLLSLCQIQRRRSLDDAEATAREALELAEKTSVQRGILRTRAHSNLARLIADTKPSEAERIWAGAVEAQTEVLGDHPEVAQLLQQRAELLRRLDRPAEAVECYRRAMRIVEESSPLELRLGAHPRATDQRLGMIYFMMAYNLFESLLEDGQIGVAEQLGEEVRRRATEADSLGARVVDLLIDARTRLIRGDLEQLDGLFSELADRVETRSLESPLWVRATIVRGTYLIETASYEEAERLLLPVYRTLNRRRSSMASAMRHPVGELIVRLFDESGQARRAARWRDRIEVVDE